MQTNYHWHTLCKVREKLLDAYEAVYDVHDTLRRGDTPTEAKMKTILTGMADVLACGGCGAIVPKLDKACFVAKCGHIFHKEPTNCWERAGRNCNLPQCSSKSAAG